ncbi:hypothetical protein POJ06DRAFT_24943 [Lipomyces tetrasporus]|uniref:Uncharacterized protein n=1 Tax=Lipomyces tetrasporus TaxID=54092 RepID=A0AAD7QMD7_9ASCO|nr:uncharacterized protein POJ06DRAFT_24943 [Lipomyces tetrasporus]KAJ8097906.1 hypothetical protein POJ06DRAFT_24943 [Lipomyces tetrasporus]
MDSSRINDFKANVYIPRPSPQKAQAVPVQHPSLIMQDNTTDASHRLKCGCAGDECVFARFAETCNGEKALHRVYEEQYHLRTGTPISSDAHGIISSSPPPARAVPTAAPRSGRAY